MMVTVIMNVSLIQLSLNVFLKISVTSSVILRAQMHQVSFYLWAVSLGRLSRKYLVVTCLQFLKNRPGNHLVVTSRHFPGINLHVFIVEFLSFSFSYFMYSRNNQASQLSTFFYNWSARNYFLTYDTDSQNRPVAVVCPQCLVILESFSGHVCTANNQETL